MSGKQTGLQTYTDTEIYTDFKIRVVQTLSYSETDILLGDFAGAHVTQGRELMENT